MRAMNELIMNRDYIIICFLEQKKEIIKSLIIKETAT